ncbi:MAG: extracellular solute-binding protein [Actinomycetota bacterium]|nr:extracellular solute-binding protein [Actinomycetota bacterium]
MAVEPSRSRGLTRRDFLRMSGAGLAGASLFGSTACGGSTGSGPVQLTFWSWVPDIINEVKLFEKAHPNIKIKYVNAGQGTPEYTKLRTVLKSGSGVPDVVQIEFQYIPTFKQIDALADISPHGANDVKDDFAPWSWGQVSEGTKVYAIPQDGGPMGLLYRKDIFDKYNLKVPQTWDEFAKEAIKLHQSNSGIYITDFPTNDGGWFTGLLWQAGSRPFKVNGTDLTVNINDAAARKVAAYWQKLIDANAVDTAPDFNNEWYSALDRGKYALWISAAWGPVFLSGVAKQSSGKWRAALLPQWSPGEHVSANWGGSTSAVTKQSEYPKEATEFAIWLNHNSQSAKMLADKSFLFPTLKSLLESSDFQNKKTSFYGGQEVNKIFTKSSKQVDLGFEWSPFQDYVYTQMTDQLGSVGKGSISLTQALDNLQDKIVSYAKSQGFHVKG